MRTSRLPVRHRCLNQRKISPAQAYTTQRVLRDVVVNLERTVFLIQRQGAPLVKRVVDRLGRIGLRRQCFELCHEPRFVDLKQRSGFLRKRSYRTGCPRRDDAGNLIPIKCNRIRLMQRPAHGRQLGSWNYLREFRETVAAEANNPNRSIAEVARAHGLNANMVEHWRRRSQEAQNATPAVTGRRNGASRSGGVKRRFERAQECGFCPIWQPRLHCSPALVWACGTSHARSRLDRHCGVAGPASRHPGSGCRGIRGSV